MVPERSDQDGLNHAQSDAAAPANRRSTTPVSPMDPDFGRLAALIERCVPELSRRSRALLPVGARSHMCPDDLVQDVMLTTWRLAHHIQPDEQFGLMPYVQRALTNRAHTEARRTGRRARTHSAVAAQIEESGPSPLDRILEVERSRQVKKALARLPLRSRRLVLARYAREWPWEQIANAMEFHSADAARVATSRAVDRLASHLLRSTSASRLRARPDARRSA